MLTQHKAEIIACVQQPIRATAIRQCSLPVAAFVLQWSALDQTLQGGAGAHWQKSNVLVPALRTPLSSQCMSSCTSAAVDWGTVARPFNLLSRKDNLMSAALSSACAVLSAGSLTPMHATFAAGCASAAHHALKVVAPAEGTNGARRALTALPFKPPVASSCRGAKRNGSVAVSNAAASSAEEWNSRSA
jgi:hypothetical protein